MHNEEIKGKVGPCCVTGIDEDAAGINLLEEREPLTEEEIDKIWVEHILSDPNVFRYNFARAIEHHHGIMSI